MGLTRPRYSQIVDTDYKNSVRVATTGDVGNLVAGYQTNSVDGITLNVLDRILVKDQGNTMQNGLYQVLVVGTGSNGTWTRASDANVNDKVTSGLTTIISEGTVNSGREYRLTTPDPITLDTTNLSFTLVAAQPAGANTYVQFNDMNVMSGSPGLTFNKTSNVVTVSGNISAGNVNGINSVHFANAGATTSKVYQVYNSSTNSLDTVFG